LPFVYLISFSSFFFSFYFFEEKETKREKYQRPREKRYAVKGI
jgi:hypothetical protein